MAKEKGLMSPEGFAQLQKYMECESSFQSFSSETYPRKSLFLLIKLPSPPQFPP
jgi:hypothetical protein